MTSPLQVDRRSFQVAAATPEAAVEAIRGRAQEVHPDADLYLDVFGERSLEGLYTVIADYWAIILDSPV